MQLNAKDYLKDLISLRHQKEFSREFYFRWYKCYFEQQIRTKLPISILEQIIVPKKFQHKRTTRSSIPLDVVLPLIEKDLEVAQLVIESVRRHIKQPIRQIFVVAPIKEGITVFCKQHKLRFVDENTVLGYSKRELTQHTTKERASWYFQQLLKLGADSFVKSPYFLVIDADTVLCKDRIFVDNKHRCYLDFSDEYHEPYYRMYERLLKLKHTSPISFVSHSMVISTKYLIEMKQLIEKAHKKAWDQAIVENISTDHPSCFSEYETYANYVWTHHPNQIVLDYWFNKSFKRSELADALSTYKDGKNLKSLSFHLYRQ